jgi:hypothetical protein
MFVSLETTVTTDIRGRSKTGVAGMDTAMTLNWLEMRRISNARSRQDDQARILTLTRENARLADENHRLHQQYQDLLASTDIWIRLYEAALDRANGTDAVPGLASQPSNLVN